MILETLEAYWAKVDRRDEDGCWIWKGARTTGGYGQISSRSTHRSRTVRALATHVALAIDGRARPQPNAVAMHSCDNPRCVNPRHLNWGTTTENMQDMWRKGRAGTQRRIAEAMDLAASNLPRRRGGLTKLDAKAVAYIRSSDKRTCDLARELDVSWTAIDNVRKGKVWKDVA